MGRQIELRTKIMADGRPFCMVISTFEVDLNGGVNKVSDTFEGLDADGASPTGPGAATTPAASSTHSSHVTPHAGHHERHQHHEGAHPADHSRKQRKRHERGEETLHTRPEAEQGKTPHKADTATTPRKGSDATPGTAAKAADTTSGTQEGANNPTNLHYAGQEGATPGRAEDGGHIANFSSLEKGMKAGAKQALKNYNEHGLKTMRGMIGRWSSLKTAPASVAKNMGVGLDEDLRLNEPKRMDKFLKALTLQEDVNYFKKVPQKVYDYATDSSRADGATGSVAGGATPGKALPAPKGELAATPGRNPDIANVDPRLRDILGGAQRYLPKGYTATVNEGYNPHGHVGASQHHVKGSGALDVSITDPHGRVLPNEGGDPTGMYTRLARGAYTEMKNRHPDLEGKLAWGGAFGASRHNRKQDLMHFDLGGERGAYVANRLSNLGTIDSETEEASK